MTKGIHRVIIAIICVVYVSTGKVIAIDVVYIAIAIVVCGVKIIHVHNT